MIRSFKIRIKNKEDIEYLSYNIKTYKHISNIYTIILNKLLKNDYESFKILMKTMDLKGFILNQNIKETNKNYDKKIEIREKLKSIFNKNEEDKLFQSFIDISNSVKEHNLILIYNEVKKGFQNFFKAIKSKNKEAKPPKAKKLNKTVFYTVLLDPYASVNMLIKKKKLRVNILNKPRYFHIDYNDKQLLKLIKNPKILKSLSIQLANNNIYLIFSYEKEEKEIIQKPFIPSGIDLGLNNIASIYIHDKISKSLIISGKPFKAYNSKFNKLSAKIQQNIEASRKEKNEKQIEYWKDYQNYIYEKRNRYFSDNFHKLAKRILGFLQQNNVTDLVVSSSLASLKNNGKIKMLKKTKQSFVQIPFIRLVKYLKEKANEFNIKVIDVSEAYSSKSSVISDNVNLIQKNHDTTGLNGNRVKRGLYKDNNINKIFNADLNGASNIVKIGFKDLNFKWLKNHLFKLCNPTTISTREFSLWLNTEVDKENYYNSQCQCSNL